MSKGSEVGSEQAAGGRGKLRTENSELRTGRSETLPKGWYIGSLLEIVNSVKTGVPEFKGEKEYYSTGSIQGKMFIPEGVYSIKNKPSRANRIALKNDVFQARMKETDKGLITDDKLSEQLFSTGFLQLRPYGETYSSKLLYYYIISPGFINQKDELATGSTQEALTDNNAVNLSFPLPPLNEQMRIVAKLDKIMPRIDAVKERLDKVPAMIKRFKQSVLTAVVTGKLTEKWRLGKNLPEWEEKTSGELFSFVTSGSRGWAKYYSGTGSLFLRIGNLDHFTINLDLQKKQYVKIPISAEGMRTRVQPDDILISITADVGMIGLIPGNFEEAYINQHISLARPTKSVYPSYIAWYLSSSEGQFQFQEMQKGATKVGLGLDDIKSINIPLPPLPEQREIVRHVDKLFALANKLESHYQKAKARVDKLSQSVLAKAFRGELVITEAELAEKEGRDFESAEKLLERILEEKAKLVGSRQRAVRSVRSARGSKGKQKETGGKKK